mmetsp:Transcript_71018/g.112504  ORF Transcript_71018/g.112504 Transcript_71018/m.112504 type:complete len:464 (+) Transcript_71018:75-1466(+)
MPPRASSARGPRLRLSWVAGAVLLLLCITGLRSLFTASAPRKSSRPPPDEIAEPPPAEIAKPPPDEIATKLTLDEIAKPTKKSDAKKNSPIVALSGASATQDEYMPKQNSTASLTDLREQLKMRLNQLPKTAVIHVLSRSMGGLCNQVQAQVYALHNARKSGAVGFVLGGGLSRASMDTSITDIRLPTSQLFDVVSIATYWLTRNFIVVDPDSELIDKREICRSVRCQTVEPTLTQPCPRAACSEIFLHFPFNSRLTTMGLDIVARIPSPFIAVHLRVEADWPFTKASETMVGYAAEVRKQVNTTKSLYLASGINKTSHHAVSFRKLIDGRDLNDKADYTDAITLRGLLAEELSIVDFTVCAEADYFVGLSASSFSWLVSRKRSTFTNPRNDYVLVGPDHLWKWLKIADFGAEHRMISEQEKAERGGSKVWKHLYAKTLSSEREMKPDDQIEAGHQHIISNVA